MNDDGGSRGGSRLNSASGGRDYYTSIDELVNAKDGEFKALTGKLTKDWLLCLLKDALSHLRTAQSFNSKLDMLKKGSSVNNVIIENKKFKEQMLMKLDEITAIKDKVDSMCVTSASASSAFASQPRTVPDSIHKRQLKVIGVSECVEAEISNDRALFDKSSIETISADLGTEVIIEDCRRLGKFLPSKSRTVLVTFSNIWDARKLRSKAIEQQLYRHTGVLIVPEFSYEDRQVEKKILKKRFELINQGNEKSRIRIRDLQLYVDGHFVVSDWLQLSIIRLNCRSLVSINKRFQLTNFLSNHMPDIACLSESWLDKNFCDNISLNTHYITAAHADRENGTHGGVVILCKSHVH